MSAKILDAVQEWLKGLRVGGSKSNDEPREATYDGKKVFVYSETKNYIIISYTADGTKLFSVNPNEITT